MKRLVEAGVVPTGLALPLSFSLLTRARAALSPTPPTHSRKVFRRRARTRATPGSSGSPRQPKGMWARREEGGALGFVTLSLALSFPEFAETREGTHWRLVRLERAGGRACVWVDSGGQRVSRGRGGALLELALARAFFFFSFLTSRPRPDPPLTSVPQGLDRPDPVGETGRAAPAAAPVATAPPPPPPPPTTALVVRAGGPASARRARRALERAVRSARAASHSAVSASMAASSRSRRLVCVRKRGRNVRGKRTGRGMGDEEAALSLSLSLSLSSH